MPQAEKARLTRTQREKNRMLSLALQYAHLDRLTIQANDAKRVLGIQLVPLIRKYGDVNKTQVILKNLVDGHEQVTRVIFCNEPRGGRPSKRSLLSFFAPKGMAALIADYWKTLAGAVRQRIKVAHPDGSIPPVVGDDEEESE